MKRVIGVLLLGCMAWAQSAAPAAKEQAKPAQVAPAPTIASVMDRQLTNLEKGLVEMAEAMPEEKFAFKPETEGGEFKNVRTFGAQVRHIATANYMIAAAIRGEKPPVDIGDPMKGQDGPATLSTKADIVKYLKDSFAYAHQAIALLENEQKALEGVTSPFGGSSKPSRLGLTSSMLWHMMDHYGQMAVYLRLNGIVPPASRT